MRATTPEALAKPCPTCGAEPGTGCRYTALDPQRFARPGKIMPRNQVHSERVHAYPPSTAER